MKYLTFLIEKSSGFVYSVMRQHGYPVEFACPVMDFEGIGKGGDFAKPIEYNLQKFPISSLVLDSWGAFFHTKKIPISIKNKHRAFWGMKPTKANRWSNDKLDPKIERILERWNAP